jgi:hypothetical protein
MINLITLLAKHYTRSVACKTETLFSPLSRANFADIEALLHLQRFECNRLPWTQSAIRPSALLLCLNEIEIHRRRRVIELGSGVSTIFFANLLKKLGGHLLSIDHNKEWQELVAARCHDCLDSVTFAAAPLRSVKVEESTFEWYDPDTIRNCSADYQADMMVVDGPIGTSCEMARYPAMPVLRHYLAEDFTVVLDDINRRDELLTARSWADKYNLSLSVIYARGNVGILRPHSTLAKYNIF